MVNAQNFISLPVMLKEESFFFFYYKGTGSLFCVSCVQHCRRGGDKQSDSGEPSGWTRERGDQIGQPAGGHRTGSLQQ